MSTNIAGLPQDNALAVAANQVADGLVPTSATPTPTAVIDQLQADIANEPPTRDFLLKVPVNVPDEQVKMAVQIGIMAAGTVEQGMMVILWPALTKTPDGRQTRVVGRAVVPLAKKEDVDRILHLAKVIATVNVKAAKGGTGDKLADTLEGKKAIANAARDLEAQAEGKPAGIIVA